ncbi:MAG: hypothetical protein JO303_16890 [Caulobacteraceae bacterium]|nr:hypothetical protein [Caulobacteraceae bacterium]
MTPDLAKIAAAIDDLIETVETASAAQFEAWRPMIERRDFEPSARNLAAYLAAQHHDLRPLQRALAAFGLSSLGRMEGRVLETLHAVKTATAALGGQAPAALGSSAGFYAGERRLAAHARSTLGITAASPTGLLITCPS